MSEAGAFAVIHSVSGNIKAFQACVDYCREVGVERIASLGGLLGIGGGNIDCVNLAREVCQLNLQGLLDQRFASLSKGIAVLPSYSTSDKIIRTWAKDFPIELACWVESLPTECNLEEWTLCSLPDVCGRYPRRGRLVGVPDMGLSHVSSLCRKSVYWEGEAVEGSMSVEDLLSKDVDLLYPGRVTNVFSLGMACFLIVDKSKIHPAVVPYDPGPCIACMESVPGVRASYLEKVREYASWG